MSDNDNTPAATGSAPQFTERELQLLGWAMQSLKSGPPEVDYEKLAGYAGMGNPRSASNAWAKIKFKLGGDGAAPATPKKAAAGRKKAAPKEEDSDEGAATPKKTPRKRAAKKQDVNGETSPKKKTTRGKKASDDDEAINVESDDVAELKPSGSPMKIDPAEFKEEKVEDVD